MKQSDKTLVMKEERDLQGEGGGGLGYDNPALSVSQDSVENANNVISGSNAFILVDEDGSESTSETCCDWFKTKMRSAFRKKMIYKRLPILNWLPKYNSTCAVGDLVAGITVGLTVIPQSLAYSNIAGLAPQYGLYGSFLGCFIYIIFGSCKDVPMGPTAIASLLTNQAVSGNGPEYAILLCFLSGLIEVLMGIFGLGFLIDFVSGPVSSGFTSAVALIICTSQVKDVLGITIDPRSSTFLEMWTDIIKNITDTRLWDVVLGIACIIILLLMRELGTIQFGQSTKEKSEPTKFQNVLNKLIWLISTSRNAILVVMGGVLGYLFYIEGEDPPFKIIKDIPPGMPSFQVPAFSVDRDNRTESFLTMIQNMGSGIVVVPLIALLENIAICKAFANGKSVDATQELVAIGLSNMANSFVQGFPGTGSLSRSAVLNSSGSRTPLNGLYTGALVIAALLFFTPYFFYIPKAALAAVIIAAVVFMVEVKVVKPMWRTKKSDLVPGLTTFIACLLLPLEYGIIVGIGVNILFILYHAARPKISIEKLTSHSGLEYLMITPDRCLIFPSVDYVRNLVTKQSIRQGLPVVIDCSHIYGADYTAATTIQILTKDFATRRQPLFFYNLKPSLSEMFEGLEPTQFYVYYNQEDVDRLLKDKSLSYPNQLNV